MKVNEHGSVSLMIGATEMGTGAATTATAQICAEELGVQLDDVDVICSDSETSPADFGTYGSRVTTLAGNAVRDACEQVRAQLYRVAAETLEAGADELAVGDRKVFVAADPSRSMDLAEVVQSSIFRDRDGRQIMAQAHFDAPCDLPDPETGVGDFAMSYSSAPTPSRWRSTTRPATCGSSTSSRRPTAATSSTRRWRSRRSRAAPPRASATA